MIIIRTPFRISFFGGGTDFVDFYRVHGGAVISTTIDKYCFVNLRHLPPFFEYKSHITYNRQEEVSKIDDIRHPLIREAMRRYDQHRVRLIYDADLPAKSGLGTSSSFAVGLVHAFSCMREKYVSKKYLADEAILLERGILKEVGGVQDQIAAAFGGLNKITFSRNSYSVVPLVLSKKRRNMLNENLMLFFTGISRVSSHIQQQTLEEGENRNKILLEILQLVSEAEKILVNEDCQLSEFGKLLDAEWHLKRSLSNAVSTAEIDEMYNIAQRNGAIGGKLLGAGGGGFLLLYVEKEKQQSVQNALSNFLYIPFHFEYNGSQVVHYDV